MNYPLSLNSFPELFFVIVFVSALAILLFVFAKDMIVNHDKSTCMETSRVTHEKVEQYFTDNGYVVCNISQVKNENKWFGYLIKNGEYLLATAFTNGELVERHIDSLE